MCFENRSICQFQWIYHRLSALAIKQIGPISERLMLADSRKCLNTKSTSIFKRTQCLAANIHNLLSVQSPLLSFHSAGGVGGRIQMLPQCWSDFLHEHSNGMPSIIPNFVFNRLIFERELKMDGVGLNDMAGLFHYLWLQITRIFSIRIQH